MRYIQNYNQYQQIDEGMKNWIATFLLLANMGLAPAHVVAGSKEDKKEFVETLDVDKREGALFVDYLNKLGKVTDLESTWSKFKQDNNLKSDYQDIEKYVNRDGKVYRFDKKYITHDYANVDINNFIPTNWMTDMGDIIEDSREPEINNWISDYEKLTSVEIGIITVNNLGEYPDVDGYLTAPDNEVQLSNVTSRKGLTQPSRNNFIKQKLEDLYQLYTKLGYQNEAVLEIGSDIIKDSLLQKKLDIKISRTGENEILIFREIEGTFNNIIIDEDADIEYLHIPLNRSETYNEHYSFVDNFDTFTLASKL